MTQAARLFWMKERPFVFAGRLNGKVVGRVSGDGYEWDWASYRNGATHDSGKSFSFEEACAQVELSASEKNEAGDVRGALKRLLAALRRYDDEPDSTVAQAEYLAAKEVAERALAETNN